MVELIIWLGLLGKAQQPVGAKGKRMQPQRAWLCSAILIGLSVGLSMVPRAACAPGYDPYLQDNLKRSRDALLSQRAELKRAFSDTQGQIDRLNQKLTRIDQYIRQVDQALNDVDAALRNAK